MTATATLTLGGLLAALVILIANLYPWWTGGRELSKLAAFGKGFGAAACAAACPGGVLGWAHGRAGTVANGAGGRTGTAATGTTTSSGLTSGQLVGLSATGAVVVVIAVTIVVLSYKAAGKKDRRRIIGGAFVGSVLCLTAGVAGALSWLPGALNATGDGVVAAIEGAGIL
ncbi:hypothetical protein [Streptomyces acidiscabies]|uniref:Sulphur transport domain-containing protein n=1 Tax=Streptomyces acidiscabies TaxID=42234 RepID=A0ABU4LWN3_9ACTN|nr:hypothetical protein [Streptomyces acidiscabies]MDX3019877.1 hypothetical protein [Streptomyces acidiscabies]